MSVSYKKFTRPDSSNNEDMLVPDVQTSSEDAYDKAVELLNRQQAETTCTSSPVRLLYYI